MKIRSIRKELHFTPKFNGNEELPESERIVVSVKSFPTLSEANSYKSYRMSEGGGIEIMYSNDAIMLARYIGPITNVELDPEFSPVTNGPTLAKSECLELLPLVSEIREYLLEASEVVDAGEN